MIIFLINKIFAVLFFISLLNILSNVYKIFRIWVNTENEEIRSYKITKKNVWFLGLALSYIITCIFYGITY